MSEKIIAGLTKMIGALGITQTNYRHDKWPVAFARDLSKAIGFKIEFEDWEESTNTYMMVFKAKNPKATLWLNCKDGKMQYIITHFTLQSDDLEGYAPVNTVTGKGPWNNSKSLIKEIVTKYENAGS